MNNPLISIIVPVYNMEKYLSNCVDSLLRQTYENLEILLIENGSTDKSLQICRKFAEQDARCKVFHLEKAGLGIARNTGLRYAKGEYITFIDGDDYVDEEFIETLYEDITSGDYDFSMVGFSKCFDYVTPSPKSEKTRHVLTQKDFMNGLYNRLPSHLSAWTDLLFMVVWNKLYKRELLNGLTFSDETMSEDLEFNNRVYIRSHKAILNEVKLHHYYQRVDSMVHKSIDKSYICRLLLHHKCLNDIPENETEYRGVCMSKLYKTLLSTRYLMRKLRDKDERKEINRMISDVKQRTFKEMLHNPYIPLRMKILFVFFYLCPLSYRSFLFYYERKARHNGQFDRQLPLG